MKKFAILVVFVLLLALSVSLVSAKDDGCTAIKDGILTYSAGHYLEGQALMLGFDPFGYNYHAHSFSGSYANAYLGRYGFPPYTGDTAAYVAANPGVLVPGYAWFWDYRDTQLGMKWNDAWLSNKDCVGDGKLDRYYGFPSYIGSGAWLTNHEGDDYFVKIVAVPADANEVDDVWYAADGSEIGPEIWGAFAIIQEVIDGEKVYGSPFKSGFGAYAP